MQAGLVEHGVDIERDAQGIPVKGPAGLPIHTFVPGVLVYLLVLGQPLAWLIYKFGSRSAYDTKIDTLASGDLGWLYLTLFVFKHGWGFITAIGLHERSVIHVNPPDQHVYKVMHPKGAAGMPYVLMESEGAIGRFNRAQRASLNYIEYTIWNLAMSAAVSFVFPFPVFLLSLGWVGMRTKGALGYTRKDEERFIGLWGGHIFASTVEVLALIIGFKAIMRAE